MTQHSQPTRLEHYINTLLSETHGHQRKAFGDFVAALLVVCTCCQATLARYFANFEAASRRLTRWLHNARVDVQAQAHAHAQLLVHQLPPTGPVRVAVDWTTEDQQQVLMEWTAPSHITASQWARMDTPLQERGRIRDEVYNTRDRCGKAGVSIAWRRRAWSRRGAATCEPEQVT